MVVAAAGAAAAAAATGDSLATGGESRDFLVEERRDVEESHSWEGRKADMEGQDLFFFSDSTVAFLFAIDRFGSPLMCNSSSKNKAHSEPHARRL